MPHSRSIAASASLIALALSLPLPAAASWPTDPAVNIPLCTAPGLQGNTGYRVAIADGAGGAIIAWGDNRSGDLDVYAQRVSATGAIQWTLDGLALCDVTGGQFLPHMVSDGEGGAIVTWRDHRNGNSDIYAQRISADGTIQWAQNGVALCTDAANQEDYDYNAASDGAGGAIVAWNDFREGYFKSIYAQRVSASGAVQWVSNGVPVCTAPGMRLDVQLIPDGAGGAIFAWTDDRTGNQHLYGDDDIYAQRISAAGALLWPSGGIPLCTTSDVQWCSDLVPDGAGGAIIAWMNTDFSVNFGHHAQRVSADGTIQWAKNGVVLSDAGGPIGSSIPSSRLISDDQGGAIVAWTDHRSGTDAVYAQRISAGGTIQWTENGVALCTAAGSQFRSPLVSDGAGGAIITWTDGRADNGDIYAQHISNAGTLQWNPEGVAISTAAGKQIMAFPVSDGANGAIVTWTDYRLGGDDNGDTYAQRVLANGELGGSALSVDAPPVPDFAVRVPNPVIRGNVDVSLAIPAGRSMRVDLVDLAGRVVARQLVTGTAARQTVTLARSSDVAPGIYMVRVGVENPVVARVAVIR